MNKEEIHILIVDYLSNRINHDDYTKLMAIIEASKHDAELSLFMSKVWDSQSIGQSFSDTQTEILYQKIVRNSRFKTKANPSAPLNKQKLKLKKIAYLVLASSAVMAIISTVTFLHFNKKSNLSKQQNEITSSAILPGGNNATLTLANGKKILLNNLKKGEVLLENDIKITKTEDGELVYSLTSTGNLPAVLNTIETPNGGQYRVVLPDGTVVWLNAHSSLKYPTNFDSANSCNVTLTGEGYFEVAHNPKKPFIVSTNNQTVKVFGTHFNINAYNNEPFTTTTLIEGSINVNLSKDNTAIGTIIKPGEQSKVHANHIAISKADIEGTIAWKNGYFIFDNEDLGSIMRKIERWYDVDVVFIDGMQNRVLAGATPRSKNLSEILRKFELIGNITFKIEGRRITVMP